MHQSAWHLPQKFQPKLEQCFALGVMYSCGLSNCIHVLVAQVFGPELRLVSVGTPPRAVHAPQLTIQGIAICAGFFFARHALHHPGRRVPLREPKTVASWRAPLASPSGLPTPVECKLRRGVVRRGPIGFCGLQPSL